MVMYADIALPVAVNKTFTYLVPPELEKSALIGARAVVPFGTKYATGLIIAHLSSSAIAKVKPIRDILDPSPVVSDELLRLCTWIADYYFAPVGEVFKAAIPHGFTAGSKRLVRLTSSVTDATITEVEKHSRKRAQLLRLLKDHGSMLSTDVQRRTGLKNINAVLIDMAAAGHIKNEEVISQPKRTLFVKEFVELDKLDGQRVDRVVQLLSQRKKRARLLLTTLQMLKQRGSSEIAVTDVLKKSGASSATLKEFRISGLLPILRREVHKEQQYGTEEQTLTIVLNDMQKEVLFSIASAIDGSAHKTFLLHGVTGSGKTQVYIEAIRHCLKQGKTAIVLVPEISLTPQIVRRFKSHFADEVAVVHSRMSAGERLDVWRRALQGNISVVIGPRSAVFAPLKKLGLIVVDEEHEASYKQFDANPRYNARDVAIVRAHYNNAVVVLGTATPSVESYSNALAGKYELLAMPSRIDEVPMPEISLVDMSSERKREYAAMKETIPPEQKRRLREFQQSSVSPLLQQKIKDRLERKEGIILLQNRRGFAPFVECVDCGYTETCDNCSITLTYHLAKKHLRCHYCGIIRTPHAECPQCRGLNIQLRGIGTQRVEEELAVLYPQSKVLRMDLDTTSRKGTHDRILRKFGGGEADILLGTQMVAKGLDFPRVTLVGVISADTQMLLPDFRSSERTFQLLTQVAGRAGRSALRGEVVIQTHQPNHYTLQHVVDHDFKAFYEQELEARRELEYPPFSRLVLIETKGKKENEVQSESERFARLLKHADGAFTVLGPSPAVIAKINNQYRWHIIVKNTKATDPSGQHLRSELQKVCNEFGRTQKYSVRLVIDVDPVGLM